MESTGNFTEIALAALPISVLAFFIARVVLHGFSDDILRYFSMDLLDDASTLIACCAGAFLCHRPAPSDANEIKLRLPYFAL
mmetsp:Transcript_41013/g.88887  ORF Transcript_41013/g.88887 Transcript_41013/m.88887 type:complete len:82 (-) Transcript_41013:41-286(-)